MFKLYFPNRGDRILLPRSLEKTVKHGKPSQSNLEIVRRASHGGNRHTYLLPKGAEVVFFAYKGEKGYHDFKYMEIQVEYMNCRFNISEYELRGADIIPSETTPSQL